MGRGNSLQHAEEHPYELMASPSHLLHRVEQLASDRFAQLVGDGLTLRQFTVLAAAAEAKDCSQRDLARRTGIDRSTLADLLARMEKRGWVARCASAADARAVTVSVTAAGMNVLHQATKHARAADAAILDALPRTKRKTFVNVLVKLARLSAKLAEDAERETRRKAKQERRDAKVKPSKAAAGKPAP